jgi:glycosyltransferase involved in cell wall biosynthesis
LFPSASTLSRFESSGQTKADDLKRLDAHGIEPPFIAFAGTLEPRKNVPGLIDAFTRIAPTHNDLRLVVAGGDVGVSTAVRDAIASSGVATRIVRPATSTTTRSSRCCAVPTWSRTRRSRKASACRRSRRSPAALRFVTSAGSALAEVVGDAAAVVDANDAGALASATIASILEDPARAAALREAGPRRAAEFTWDRCVDQCVEAYSQADTARTA